ncbi:DUF6153 family protein [Streptomyces sp. NPDC004980]
MSVDKKSVVPQQALRNHGLLVLAVLLGLLGMHALGPGPLAAQTTASYSSPSVVLDASDHCDHDCSGHGGHGEHADPTCASAAVSGSIALPAPQPALICSGEPAAGLVTRSTAAPGGGRAPPSLSELQLLRI